MENTSCNQFFRDAFVRIKQKFCHHSWVYKRSVTLVARRRAEYVCKKCGKIGHMTYSYDCELKVI